MIWAFNYFILTTSTANWPNPGPWPVGDNVFRLRSSGRNVLELKLNRPNWLHTRECLTRNTSKMSPEVLARSGSCKNDDKLELEPTQSTLWKTNNKYSLPDWLKIKRKFYIEYQNRLLYFFKKKNDVFSINLIQN